MALEKLGADTIWHLVDVLPPANTLDSFLKHEHLTRFAINL